MLSKYTHNLLRYSFIARQTRFLSTSRQAFNVKPFYYQELFEHAHELNTPFKKLTGKYLKKLNKRLTVYKVLLRLMNPQLFTVDFP